jgi:anaerobic magnesium-protoporphyrin IX monomethyl ester cyclase
MTDVLLINPSYSNIIYAHAKIKVGVPGNPLLNLAMLASPVIDAGYKAKILDLNLEDDPDTFLAETIKREQPSFAGITFTTPLSKEAVRIAKIIKDIKPDTILVCGGAHSTTFFEEMLETSEFDVVAVGESDYLMKSLLEEKDWSHLKGIAFKKNGEIIKRPKADYIEDLDTLPFPSWKLYNLERYDKPTLSSRFNPPGYLETSRGCPWGCVFCNKNIQGRKFRSKSPSRVVDEIEYMLDAGFKEINIIDDTFSTDIQRAKEICGEIIRRGLKFPWHPINGIRVDRVDKELFRLMKMSGCYKMSFGIESGNQKILDMIKKGIKLKQVRDAVKWAQELDFETFGYFMIGLPGETEETIKDTIKLAKELKLDIAKFNITIPLPGTEMFEEWNSKGFIKTRDWGKYNFYSPYQDLYTHPTLDYDAIDKNYRKAYLSFYFTPAYLLRRFRRSVKEGTLLRDIYLFFKTDWLN